jgi:hypothetical protein
LADSLGGSGEIEENLFTCFHFPFNDPNMKGLEKQVKDAVKREETVDYTVIPIYRRGQLVPSMVRMTARGTTKTGQPGLYFDKCLGNNRQGWVTNGGVCGP